MCLSESRVYTPLMPHLSSLPPQHPKPRSTSGVSFDLVELLQQVFDEPEREAERRLDAVKRRRDFRLIQERSRNPDGGVLWEQVPVPDSNWPAPSRDANGNRSRTPGSSQVDRSAPRPLFVARGADRRLSARGLPNHAD